MSRPWLPALLAQGRMGSFFSCPGMALKPLQLSRWSSLDHRRPGYNFLGFTLCKQTFPVSQDNAYSRGELLRTIPSSVTGSCIGQVEVNPTKPEHNKPLSWFGKTAVCQGKAGASLGMEKERRQNQDYLEDKIWTMSSDILAAAIDCTI
ncbi:hypothetical protein HGM15179_016502 [Zosterops borbonicus]|uniref:Uncharacterized protein n=1 Tax=Zosterops borbonicus TaxID=364589 RepID=A0A8K1G2H7_9PASS|nr:hypothetical protein HGM15179_016502 [Zosterops borbonicus]